MLSKDLSALRQKKAFLCDMDGVLYHGNRLLPSVPDFVDWLHRERKKFLFLTNGSGRSPKALSEKLSRMGLSVPPEHFCTSAQITAAFLASQKPGASVFVIGDDGLREALCQAGLVLRDEDVDYVVFGGTRAYSYEGIAHAVKLVRQGARLIGANADLTTPTDRGILPACRSLIAPIELASGQRAYFTGKPNPLMLRHALRLLDCRPEDAVMIGDRMDTDIRAGVEGETDTLLVLSGISTEDSLRQYAFRPRWILERVGDICES